MQIAVQDLDGDGDLDIVCGGKSGLFRRGESYEAAPSAVAVCRYTEKYLPMPVEEPELNAPAGTEVTEVTRGGRGPRRPSRPHGTRHRHLPWRTSADHGGTSQFAGAGSISSGRIVPSPWFPQVDPRVEAPSPEDLFQVGTLCVMHKAIKVPKDNLLLFCDRHRAAYGQATSRRNEPFLRARVERLPDVEPEITPRN